MGAACTEGFGSAFSGVNVKDGREDENVGSNDG